MRASLLAASALLVALVACTPPLAIKYEVSDGPSQRCGASTCEEVPMPCESVLHVRVLSPERPETPHISICEPVEPNQARNLCALADVPLPVVEMPRETLEVQVTVWPADAVPRDPVTNELNCLANEVEFDAFSGFPISGPALGGRAFYRPGDDETVVTLGCTDLELVNAPACLADNTIAVDATVADFELLPFDISVPDADQLNVFVGEPKQSTIGSEVVYELNPSDTRPLERVMSPAPPPAWTADLDLTFAAELQQSACLQVLEDAPGSIAVVRCKRRPEPLVSLDLRGIRVTRESLQQIIAAAGLPAFPDQGITIGIVLDPAGAPASGYTVTSTQGTIKYLNAARDGIANVTKTTASGMFLSLDAPYGTFFDAMLTIPLGQQIGGKIEGKVTFVLFGPPENEF